MHATTIRRAFTLVELLVVMIIIAVIIAIVLPAVGGVRNSARKQGTAALLSSVSQASQQFYNDQKRMPGFFSERDLGAIANETAGMTSMENILLDLMGAETASSAQPGGATWIEVGPGAGNVFVNYDLLGAGSESSGAKNYFLPDPKLYVAQTSPLQQVADGSLANAASSETDPQLKDLVDYWGQPILAWRQDETAIGPVTILDQFAKEDSAGNPARFYWNSNGAFLNSQALGRRGRDQTDPNNGSLLNQSDKARALAALLGHPSYPNRVGTTPNMWVPASARGKLVLHSAGADAVYLGRKDTAGANQFVGGTMNYGTNFVPDPSAAQSASNQYQTDDNKADQIDVLAKFDDVTEATGN